jgi:uncharacterized membrane protein
MALSNGVIAIAITLPMLDIPRWRRPRFSSTEDLGALWPSDLAHVVTFMSVDQVWANHRVMFDHTRAADLVRARFSKASQWLMPG